MLRIETQLTVYQDDKMKVGSGLVMMIINHWNWSDRFWLEVEGKKYLILKEDILKAIENACNH